MIYTRKEKCNGFARVTTVDDVTGVYEQWVVWDDGTRELSNKTTVESMGWDSVAELLRTRPCFVKEGALLKCPLCGGEVVFVPHSGCSGQIAFADAKRFGKSIY